MKRLNSYFLPLAISAAFCLQACTTSTGSDDDSFTIDRPDFSFEDMPLSTQELIFTNILLDAYYVNATTELQEYDKYLGKGAKHGYTEDNFEFPDVSYMYSTLSDNFTNYYSPYMANRILNLLTYSETDVGIGAQVRESSVPACEQMEETCTDSTTILEFSQVYKGAPAENAGIKKGDVVLSVNGTVPASSFAFDKLTSGKEGETITLDVFREGDSLQFEIELAPFITPTVFVDMYDTIPVITITEFTDTTTLPTGTYGEFLEALKETEGASATVIDLRNNPGGTVDHCINAASELLAKNDTIVTITTHFMDSLSYDALIDTTTYVAETDGIGKGRYYVFLADSGSASCAEVMLAGVINTTKSPVVGLTTYGKGIGQSYMMTIGGGITGITSMKIFDKFGKSYHRYGIVPDYEEGDTDKALKKALELASAGKETHTSGYGTKDTGHFTLAKSHSSSKKPERGAFRIIRTPAKNFLKPAPLK